MNNAYRLYAVMILGMLSSCYMQQNTTHNNPPGYDLATPAKWIMPEELDEISGIAFHNGDNGIVYAEQDEEGHVYQLQKGSKKTSYTKFGKPGDFEDIAINKEYVIMLRSDGVLFTFPLSETNSGKTESAKEWKDLLPSGEYESLAAGRDGNLVVVCKNCPVDNQEKEASAYVLEQDTAGGLSLANSFKIDISAVRLTSIHKETKFHPSCVAQHPLTHQWFLISSVNKVLIVLDEQWNVIASYPLDPAMFKQPEGLAFDKQGTMYISNENADIGNANILTFPYKP